MKRLGIYGGSFNPIHAGHVGVALKAAADHALDQVLVVPAKVSPFKTLRASGDFGFTDAQRWEMSWPPARPIRSSSPATSS